MAQYKDAESFYTHILSSLLKTGIPFLVGGGIAVREYSPLVTRPTKDLDIFCKGGDYPKIVGAFQQEGFQVLILDERWLAKVKYKKYQTDIIFGSVNYINKVDDSWLENAKLTKFLGMNIKFIAPEELIWCKAYIQDRSHYDGADINHIILHQGKNLDWKRLLARMENHWELLLGLLLNFRFVFPSERGLVPKWLMEELMERLTHQLSNPIPKDKICRGPLLSRTQYVADITKGEFQTIL